MHAIVSAETAPRTDGRTVGRKTRKHNAPTHGAGIQEI